jgi:hypothetical protein
MQLSNSDDKIPFLARLLTHLKLLTAASNCLIIATVGSIAALIAYKSQISICAGPFGRRRWDS